MTSPLISMYMLTVLALILGLILLVRSILDLRKTGQTINWPKTRGSITKSEVKRLENRDESGVLCGYTYLPDIKYEYTVEGKTHTSSRIFIGETSRIMQSESKSKKQSEDIQARYNLGQDVDVYYNQENPEDAVLDPGKTWSILVFMIVSILLILSQLLALLNLLFFNISVLGTALLAITIFSLGALVLTILEKVLLKLFPGK